MIPGFRIIVERIPDFQNPTELYLNMSRLINTILLLFIILLHNFNMHNQNSNYIVVIGNDPFRSVQYKERSSFTRYISRSLCCSSVIITLRVTEHIKCCSIWFNRLSTFLISRTICSVQTCILNLVS